MMKIRSNSSNNTVYADSGGNIAYYHGNFVPRRDPSIDYAVPVDGSDPATDWQGLMHSKKSSLLSIRPTAGYKTVIPRRSRRLPGTARNARIT
jgi:acyl-homoserine lactone acylase PvdQ